MKFLAMFIGFLLATQPALASRYILEASDLENLKQASAKHGVGLLRKMDSVQGFVADLSSSQLNALKNSVADLKATEDIELFASAPPQPPQPVQSIPWGINAIQSTQAWSFARGAGVNVCIIDTGIDKTHPDLQANIIGGRNFVVIKGKIDPTKWNDDNGHGSHVAGTVAALDNGIGAVGVAPLAKLLAAKVLNSRGSGYLSDVADGVTYCVQAGAQVINMSLGATSDPNLASPLRSAVEAAINAGVVVVVAAGNEGQNINTKVPAGYPQTVAVAAVDQNMIFPTWTNFGLDTDDFTAPGVGIYSTWKSSGYNTISGTSMAAPHVAGVVALKISSVSLGLRAITLNQSISTEGAGLIQALDTVQNQ